jgi:tetratricopeptide (TPR) repeat protein
VFLGEGNLDAALRQGEYACALASRAADRWAADCHDLLGTIAVLQADWPRAIDEFEEAQRLREHGPHVVGRVETAVGIGLARQRSGDWIGARGHFEEALVTASEIDPSPWLLSAQRHLGRLLCSLGDPAGPDLIRAALDLAETMPRSIEYGPTLIAGVEAGRWRDDRTGAIDALERALTAGLTVEQRIEALCALAVALRDTGDRAAAQERLAKAHALATTLGVPRSLWLVDWTHGLVAAANADSPAAAAAFEEAVTRARAAGLPHELARALARLAALPGIDPARAASMQTEARAIGRQLGIRG